MWANIAFLILNCFVRLLSVDADVYLWPLLWKEVPRSCFKHMKRELYAIKKSNGFGEQTADRYRQFNRVEDYAK